MRNLLLPKINCNDLLSLSLFQNILPVVWRIRAIHKYVDCVDKSDT